MSDIWKSLPLTGVEQIYSGGPSSAGKVITSDGLGGATWQPTAAGGVTSITASSPLASSGGTTPNLSIDLSAYATLASPAFSGTPTAPTPVTADSSAKLATTAWVTAQGFLTSTGSIPTGEQDNATAVTSATTTFVTALTTTVTLTQTAPILALANATLTTTTAASVAGVRITINGVASRAGIITLTALTTNYLATIQTLSAPLAPGTYTVTFQIQRVSGTGTVNYVSGTLVGEGLQGTNSNGITALTGAVTAGPGNGSQVTTLVPIVDAQVAAGAALSYSKLAALATGQLLLGNAGVPTATTLGGDATIGATGTLTIANSAITNAKVLNVDALKITTGTLPVTRGGTGNTSFPIQRIPFGNGTVLLSDPNFLFDTTNQRFMVGGSGTARIGSIVTSGSTVALQAFTQGTNNAFQIRNENSYAMAVTTRSDTNGALVGGERSRGNQTAPTQSLSGDSMLQIVGNGYTGSATSPGFGASMQFVQTEDCTATANGADIIFATAANGTNTLVEKVRIKNTGETILQKALALARVTTAQKLALVATGGWVVFDTDLAQLSYYNGTVWVNV